MVVVVVVDQYDLFLFHQSNPPCFSFVNRENCQLLLLLIRCFLKGVIVSKNHIETSYEIPVFSCWTSDDIADVSESAAIRRSVRSDLVCWLIDGESVTFPSERKIYRMFLSPNNRTKRKITIRYRLFMHWCWWRRITSKWNIGVTFTRIGIISMRMIDHPWRWNT